MQADSAAQRCPGCYDSFSGPWCDNCDQWPCKCVLPCEHGVPAYRCEDCNGYNPSTTAATEYEASPGGDLRSLRAQMQRTAETLRSLVRWQERRDG